MSLIRYIIDVSTLSTEEVNETYDKIDIYAYNSSHDIPITKFDALFRENDNIEIIKAQFPAGCIFTCITHS